MNLKIKTLAASIIPVFIGCSTSSEEEKVEYKINVKNFSTDSILFIREGGGDKAFTINDTDGYYRIWIKKWEFRDTLFALKMSKSIGDSLSDRVIPGLFSGGLNISGKIYENPALTGTWEFVYVKRNHEWVRVANPTIINSISRVESGLANFSTKE